MTIAERLSALFDMTERVVVVTGGTRGIGRAMAEGYVEAGAKVVVVGRDPEWCAKAEAELRSLGGDALGISADVSRIDDYQLIIEQTLDRFGALDVLVNNAGIGPMHDIESLDLEVWNQTFDLNVWGAVFLLNKAMPHLKKSPHACVLNILSSAGFGRAPLHSTYASTKAALFAYTRSAAAGLAGYGIRVNALAPGTFATDLHLSGPESKRQLARSLTLLDRAAEPREIVGPALLLTCDAGSFITGQVVMVDGGLVIAR
jgi:NAD(P)-dependent dehydrogenase (short-subunit alcohol dehydrogenase family)